MVEGGARVASDLLGRGLVDRIHLYDSSVTIGSDGIASPITADRLPAGFVRVDERQVGADRLQIFDRLPASAWI
jgi:diaminohydroxyphosphoribosylaminopyrimidine deaminase/5-amino-6-(5-phosphoribosylamino)uracil reductase